MYSESKTKNNISNFKQLFFITNSASSKRRDVANIDLYNKQFFQRTNIFESELF